MTMIPALPTIPIREARPPYDDPLSAFSRAIGEMIGRRDVSITVDGRSALRKILETWRRSRPERDEVILPAFTCGILERIVASLGLRPVFADVEEETGVPGPEVLDGLVTEKTLAIVAVHTFGIPCEMPLIMETARRAGAFVVEDLASALGGSLGGRPLGSFGDAAFGSFGRSKALPLGCGGFMALPDPSRGPTSEDSGLPFIAALLNTAARTTASPTAWRFLERMGFLDRDDPGAVNRRLRPRARDIARLGLESLDDWRKTLSEEEPLRDRIEKSGGDLGTARYFPAWLDREVRSPMLPLIFESPSDREAARALLLRSGIGSFPLYGSRLASEESAPVASSLLGRHLMLPWRGRILPCDLERIFDVLRRRTPKSGSRHTVEEDARQRQNQIQ